MYKFVAQWLCCTAVDTTKLYFIIIIVTNPNFAKGLNLVSTRAWQYRWIRGHAFGHLITFSGDVIDCSGRWILIESSLSRKVCGLWQWYRHLINIKVLVYVFCTILNRTCIF